MNVAVKWITDDALIKPSHPGEIILPLHER